MNIPTNTNIIAGIVEHRNHIVGVYTPIALVTFDALSYAINRVESLRVEALDPDYTPAERDTIAARADFLDQWIDTGCTASVPLSVDFNLFNRGASVPAVAMNANLDDYLDLLLSASTIVPLESLDEPAFAILNNGSPELWLTENRSLRNARRFPGPDVRLIETTNDNLKAIIASQQLPRLLSTAMIIA